MNNNSPDSDRRKRLAPPPPGSTGSASPNASLNRSKRQAPPPPNPFTGALQDDDDLYEKVTWFTRIPINLWVKRNGTTGMQIECK